MLPQENIRASDGEASPQSEQILQYLLQKTPQGVIEWDTDFRVIFWNPAAESIFGYTAAEAMGRRADFITAQSDKPQVGHVCIELLAGRGGERSTNENITKDGRTIVCDWYNTPITSAGGQVIRVVSFVLDITDRKRAQEALEQSEERYRNLVELSPDAIYINRGNRVAFANQATLNLFGATQEQLLGRSLFDLMHPDFHALIRERIAAQVQGERKSVPLVEEKVVRLDGRVVDVEVAASRFQDSDGLAIQVMLRDITQRKSAEKALLQANAYNRSLIEASLDPLVTLSPDGKITDVNAATESVTGRTREQLIGTDFSDYFTDPKKAQAGYEQAFREGKVIDYALDLRHSDGHLTSVIYNASVYRDELGQVAGVFAAARDITERKRVDDALRDTNSRLQLMVAASPLAIVVLDSRGIVRSWNPAAERIFGWSEDEVLDYPIPVLRDEEHDEFLNMMNALHHGEIITDLDAKGLTKGGCVIDMSLSLAPINDSKSSINSFLSMIVDVTDRKRAEEIISQQAREILEISTPVVQLWEGVLAVPLIGMLDSERTQQVTEQLLDRIVETNSPIAIIDLTGVPMVDTQTGRHLIDTIAAVKLLGTKTLLTGIRPEIAQTLVHLGIDLNGIVTRSSLSSGLSYALDALDLEIRDKTLRQETMGGK